MTDAKQKPRKLTEQEIAWIYSDIQSINHEIYAPYFYGFSIPENRLVELMDMKSNYDKLLVRIEKLREGLVKIADEQLSDEDTRAICSINKLIEQDDEAKK